ncbi:MAG: A/G-specific adenine glycosylase [Gemmatimonadetes bacterium]|nr:A/G-specific adenine glycosylase [Gemmatimonadota bacterium]
MKSLRAPLLVWYDTHRRDLPWRTAAGAAPDPYRIWLSEVMLQQTRVEAVRPYFARWIEMFPTLESLAAADHDEVMKAWEGLGYYSRARNLHRAVREVNDRYGGQVPDDPALFRALPGVGRYTGGAVLSIAFGQQEPVVDGNVRRVFARLTNQPEPKERDLWEMAEALVVGERPGDLNQALMELGATVCLPRSPRCSACPVSDGCAARAAGTQEQRPLPRKARPLPHEQTATAVVVHDGVALMARRPESGRLGGMWEFPGSVRAAGESTAEAAVRAVLDGVGVSVAAGEPLGSVDHIFTHVRVTYEAILCTLLSGEPSPILYERARWIPISRIGELALPRAQQRIARMI